MSTLISNLADASDFEAYIEILHVFPRFYVIFPDSHRCCTIEHLREPQGRGSGPGGELRQAALQKSPEQGSQGKQEEIPSCRAGVRCALRPEGFRRHRQQHPQVDTDLPILPRRQLVCSLPRSRDQRRFRVVARFSLILFRDNEDLKKDDVAMSQVCVPTDWRSLAEPALEDQEGELPLQLRQSPRLPLPRGAEEGLRQEVPRPQGLPLQGRLLPP